MGCACKQKYSKIAEYSDEKEIFKKFNFFEHILTFLGRLFMVILMTVLIIIILPLFLAYILVCYLIGKDVRINMKKMMEYISRHRDGNDKIKEILTD